MSDDYILGLDLGQRRDYSALAIVERRWQPHPDDAGKPMSHFAIRHLQRWPLGTSYTVVAADLAALLRQPPLDRPVLVVDQTGVGQGVVDFMATRPLSATLGSCLPSRGLTSEPGS
ncbi:MAG TPA: hypothetical protein VMG10_13205 [Gemmataceae bacterium]|nr:hypothetical protein [Gemmataceae bacterium]